MKEKDYVENRQIKTKYEHVDSISRRNLIEYVMDRNMTIKSAASLLKIKYSNAKAILRKYKKISNAQSD